MGRTTYPSRMLSGDIASMLQGAIRLAGQMFSRLAPETAGRLAIRAFCRPPAPRVSQRIAALLASGTRGSVTVRGQAVATWSWGSGPRVLLVHGWGGVGGQLATFVPALLEKGYAATVLDAPAHGSSAGRESSMLHSTDALLEVDRAHGPTHAIVAHSLGASAATLAMTQGLDVQAAVFVGPPSHPAEWVDAFARYFGLTEAAVEYMRREVERQFGFAWDAIDTVTLARQQHAPLLIVHDADDEEVPIAQGREVAAAWPGARFVETHGLGHRRILSDPAVIRETAEFLSDRLTAVGCRQGSR
jgi:pimeloyl-ACP methyl ester carboxylesterase